MTTAQQMFRLDGKVQHYSWGSFEYIPQLLSVANADKQPFAEYWLGAHPNHSGQLLMENDSIALNTFIEQNKIAALGEAVAGRFGTLPFLLKVLDVRQMLSIQVHPSKASAEEGFRKENNQGIPVTAANRNYKDDNHKPELMVALSDFWLLHGFKPAGELVETLAAIPDFDFLTDEFAANGYKGLYERVMLMEQQEVNQILRPVIKRIMPLYKNGELLKSQESFWAARAVETFCKDDNYDRGIFSIYFFNLVYLKKGEGIYQPAQMPHAYLEGQNVEIMANSDNVLRAGLTDKYVDVPELLKHVHFQETVPNILGSSAEVETESSFLSPAVEFELYQYNLTGESINLTSYSAEILLVLQGEINLQSGGQSISLDKGKAAFVIAGIDYSINSNGESQIFRAAVPPVK
jgi:mannose-6-phosphate isomerase